MIVQGISHIIINTFVNAYLTGNKKIALYTPSANIGPDLIATYTSDGEVVSSGYTAGGSLLTVASSGYIGNTYVMDFNDISWSDPGLSFAVRGAMIYLPDTFNASVCYIDFGFTYNATSSFTITFPPPTESEGMIRIR